jgi:hypothetical protein
MMSLADAPQFPIADADLRPDAEPMSAYPDAQSFGDGGACGSNNDWMCTNPVGDGCNLTGGDTCDDGADNDCDGKVDEGCGCQSGAVQPCFLGPPGRRNVGACSDGMQTCQGSGEFTFWGPCTGGITPTAEVCDSLDNDCNGCDDDHPDCCMVELSCPAPGSMPDGQPFQNYVIDGTMFYPGATTSWSWTVEGGPCDTLLSSTTNPPKTSFTLTGANTSQLTLYPTLSGDYKVTVTITAADGTVYTCTFIVHIAGPGLRFELCWDTTGQADIDLHVHKDGTTTPWFTTNLNGNNVNNEDCYYMNCKANAHYCALPPIICPSDTVDWGSAYQPSPLSECQGSPEGAEWAMVGNCHNPRLDIDNISEAGRPENVNVDVPLNNSTYRAMVHYYGGSVTTHPMVNVYCGGRLKATYGQAPDEVSGFTAGGGFGAGPMWRVVDVTTQVSGGVTTDCTLAPLHPSGQTTGYWVTNDDRSY